MKKVGRSIWWMMLAFAIVIQVFASRMQVNAETVYCETDVTSAGSGKTLLGLKGSYVTDTVNALEYINQIRYEACKNGYPDPRTPSRALTLSDYKPIKWSQALEKIARIRAAEASVSRTHARLNGGSIWGVSYGGITSGGECLSWNDGNTVIPGITQWYDEKQDWINQDSSKVTGHYTMMINPNNLYIGLGTFVSEDTRYLSCLAGAFKSTCGSLGETPLDPIPDVIQKLEVSNSYITYVVEAADEIGKGTSQNLRTRAKVVYSSGNDAYLENIAGTITYTSSDPSIATVSASGAITAIKEGTVTIKAFLNGTQISSKDIEIGCAHNYSYKQNGSNYTRTCTICNKSESFRYTIYWSEKESNGYMEVLRKNSFSVGESYYIWVTYQTSSGAELSCKLISSDTDIMSVEPNRYIGVEELRFKQAGVVTLTVLLSEDPDLVTTFTFRVTGDEKADLSKADVTLDQDTYTYNGSECKPNPTITYGGVKLTKGTDYTVAYSNNVASGTGYVTVTGMGMFEGSIKKSFTIEKATATVPSVPTLSAACGDSLSQITLPAGFAWKDASQVVTGSADGNAERKVKAYATYTPSDVNYKKVDNVEISILVSHKLIEGIGAVEATCKDKGYTGDTQCQGCLAIMKTGTETEKLITHTYVNGVCSVCDKVWETTIDGITYQVVTQTVDGKIVGQTISEDGKENLQITVAEAEASVSGKVVLPSKLSDSELGQGMTVTEIAAGAFETAAVTSIIVPESVTKVGENAFGQIENLTFAGQNPPVGLADAVLPAAEIHIPDGSLANYQAALGDSANLIEQHTHEMSEWTVRTEATEDAAGEKVRTCACGYEEKEIIEKLPHTKHVKDAGTTVDPTCEEKGSLIYRCTKCGQQMEATEIPAKGHAWNEGEVTKEPTEAANGIKTYTCISCGKLREEPIEKLAPTKPSQAPGEDGGQTPAPGSSQTPGGSQTEPSQTPAPDASQTPGSIIGPSDSPNPGDSTNPGQAVTPGQTPSQTPGAGQDAGIKNQIKRNQIKSIKSKKSRQVTITWKKDKTCKGYQICFSTDKKFKKGKKTITVKSYKTTKKTIKVKKSKKTYYFKVRAYRMQGKKKVYGAYSKVKKIRVK